MTSLKGSRFADGIGYFYLSSSDSDNIQCSVHTPLLTHCLLPTTNCPFSEIICNIILKPRIYATPALISTYARHKEMKTHTILIGYVMTLFSVVLWSGHVGDIHFRGTAILANREF